MMPGMVATMTLVVPLVSLAVIWLRGNGISERHHRHHDTYVISFTLIWTLAFAMVFMGLLGLLLGWLCMVGVFTVDAIVVMSFFDAFLVVSFAYWLLLRRYKVTTYEDHMEVTPFIGRTVMVNYQDISALEWVPSLVLPKVRNVRVFAGGTGRTLLWGGLNLEQILIRIDRFDAFTTA